VPHAQLLVVCDGAAAVLVPVRRDGAEAGEVLIRGDCVFQAGRPPARGSAARRPPTLTGSKADAWCLLTHADASMSPPPL